MKMILNFIMAAVCGSPSGYFRVSRRLLCHSARMANAAAVKRRIKYTLLRLQRCSQASVSGKAILDDGREIEIKDFMGFAEKVRNKW